jgi:hypothetical protein
MDAAKDLREEERVRLLNRLAEIMVEEQRELGTFQRLPHLCELETISHSLAQRLGCVSLSRAVREVAAGCDPRAACPSCGRQCPVEMTERTVTGISCCTALTEPVAHCPACRRAFFPSAGSVGTGQSGMHAALGAGDDASGGGNAFV